MLAILWWVLKALLILLAVLLALVLVVLLLPVTAHLHYEAGQFTAAAGTLGLKWQLYPAKPKTGPEKPKKPKKPKKKKAPPAPQDGQKAAAPKKKRVPLGVSEIFEMVRTAGWLLRRILGGLTIHDVRIRMAIQGSDAADTAVKYGKTSAWLHGGLAGMRNILDIRIRELALVPDFTGEKQGTELFSCKITGRLIIIVISGLRALWQLYRGGVL